MSSAEIDSAIIMARASLRDILSFHHSRDMFSYGSTAVEHALKEEDSTPVPRISRSTQERRSQGGHSLLQSSRVLHKDLSINYNDSKELASPGGVVRATSNSTSQGLQCY